MKVREWWAPALVHGLYAAVKDGSTASELAADAHACIMWFGSHRPIGHKVAAPIPRAPDSGLPSDGHPDHNERAAVLGFIKGGAWKRRSVRQGRATAGLDSPRARRRPPTCGRGRKNGSVGGRTEEYLDTGGRLVVKSNSLIPNAQHSMKPGQVPSLERR